MKCKITWESNALLVGERERERESDRQRAAVRAADCVRLAGNFDRIFGLTFTINGMLD